MIKTNIEGEEIEVDPDETLARLSMIGTVQKITFFCDGPRSAAPQRMLTLLQSAGARAESNAVPDEWDMNVRSATHGIYNTLRLAVITDRLGWIQAATGRHFIMQLGGVLYKISTFHDRFAHFRESIPEHPGCVRTCESVVSTN